MNMFLIKDNGITYRIRKEEIGCSIFTPQYFLEGDDILFDILKIFNEYGVKNGINKITQIYSVDIKSLKKDLLELTTTFDSNKIFIDLSKEIKSVFNDN